LHYFFERAFDMSLLSSPRPAVQTYLNGTLESPIELDTSAAATDTIAYVVTDSEGLTSTSTRTVIVEPAAAPPTLPPAASSAATSSSATTTIQQRTSNRALNFYRAWLSTGCTVSFFRRAWTG